MNIDALSIKSVTGAPVKFVGMGEKLSEMEVFHPDRVAGRILGMGDVLTLLEKAQSEMEAEEAEALARKMQKAKFDLEDFRTQMRHMRKLGSLESLVKMIPGLGGLAGKLGDMSGHEKELNKTEAILNSMTSQERRKQLINEINELHIDGLPRVDRLNALVGKYVNLEYALPNGQKVKFLDDQKTYLGNQLESEFGGERCFGILAGMDFLLVCTYEKNGENPELVIYKKR